MAVRVLPTGSLSVICHSEASGCTCSPYRITFCHLPFRSKWLYVFCLQDHFLSSAIPEQVAVRVLPTGSLSVICHSGASGCTCSAYRITFCHLPFRSKWLYVFCLQDHFLSSAIPEQVAVRVLPTGSLSVICHSGASGCTCSPYRITFCHLPFRSKWLYVFCLQDHFLSSAIPEQVAVRVLPTGSLSVICHSGASGCTCSAYRITFCHLPFRSKWLYVFSLQDHFLSSAIPEQVAVRVLPTGSLSVICHSGASGCTSARSGVTYTSSTSPSSSCPATPSTGTRP